MPDLIPLEKLISRLRTDLKLADNYATHYSADISNETRKKNKKKASLLFYLEELKALKAAKESEKTDA